jgi:hypothetical protein
MKLRFNFLLLNEKNIYSSKSSLNLNNFDLKEALWLNQLFKELNRGLTEIKMMCDNKSTICCTIPNFIQDHSTLI